MIVVTGNLPALQFRAQSIPAQSKRKKADPLRDPSSCFAKRLQRNLIASVAACVLAAWLGIQSPAQNVGPQSSEREQPRPAARAHYGDVIDVDVLGGFEFDWRGSLTPEGNLDGLETFDEPVYALCRTEKEIALDVAKAYSKILRDPKVEVKIIDRSNRALARVDGAVRTPTRFSIRREVSLAELLVVSGGIVSGASGEISIVRPANLGCDGPASGHASGQNNPSLTINIKIGDLISGKASSNPVILTGDIVTVLISNPVYVIGAVNNPGAIFATGELTVSRAIATAGGPAKEADGDTVSVFRRTAGGTSTMELSLAKIRRGEVEDLVLRSFDIIDVSAKGRSKRSLPPAAPTSGVRNTSWAQMPLKIVD